MKNIIKEVKKEKVVVKITGTNFNRFFTYAAKSGISIPKNEYLNDKEIILLLTMENYKKLKERFWNYDFKIIKKTGIYKIKPTILKNKIFLLAIIFGIVFLVFLNRIIVDVKIIHSNPKIRNLVTDELNDRGIKRLSFKKNYKKIQEIKEAILKKYPKNLEWIEIETNGMTYTVRVEERIITKQKEQKQSCNIIASKSAFITKIVAYEGENIRRVNQYINAGDIIISGEIKLNEEVKGTVCASGKVYGEVWYTAAASVPLYYEKHIRTGKVHKNILFDNSKIKKTILKSRFENYDVETKEFFSLLGVKYYFQTEYEYDVIKKRYTEEEAIEKGIEIALSNVELKLKNDENIISKTVLKKNLIDDKMELEIFISVNELISEEVEFELSDIIEQD